MTSLLKVSTSAQRHASLLLWVGGSLMLAGWFTILTEAGVGFLTIGTALALLGVLSGRSRFHLFFGLAELVLFWVVPLGLLALFWQSWPGFPVPGLF